MSALLNPPPGIFDLVSYQIDPQGVISIFVLYMCYVLHLGCKKEGSVVTGLRLSDQMEQRLNHLAHETRRPKSFYIREAIQEYLEGHEDCLLVLASYEEHLKNGKKGIFLNELKKYRLDDDKR